MMKTKLSFFAWSLFLLLLAGCIPSIHPLYTSKDVVFDPLLVGGWFEKDNSNRWIFESAGDSSYKLVYYENGVFGEDSTKTISEFEVHLVKLEDHYFLDFYPGNNDHLPMSTLLAATLLPVHTFAKLVYDDGQFDLSFFSSQWLEQSITDKTIKIAHEKTSNQIVLTAPTKELQEMVLQNVDNREAFVEPTTLMKTKK